MTIEFRERTGGRTDVMMTECEFCDQYLGKRKSFPNHWRYECPENPANAVEEE